MTKIPVLVLVKMMLGLPKDAEEAVASLTGAYAICMDPCIEAVGRTLDEPFRC